MRIPTATYRLQFSPNLGFAGAQAILPYLADLGITDLYASPIFLTRRGSMHGYDIVDPNRLNPELGTEADFTALTDEMRRCGMRWLQDIVPNHMAYDAQNKMLMDVIENGPSSAYAGYFDIDWNHPYESIRGKVLAPFLGQFYSESLESGDIQLRYNETGLSVSYFDFSLPLAIESYIKVFARELNTIKRKLGTSHGDFIKLLGVLYTLKNIPAIEEGCERPDQVLFVKGMLWELYTTNEEIRKWLDDIVVRLNGIKGQPETFSALDQLLSEQRFRLSFWKVAAEEINYRRFFNINELISLRVEDDEIFRNTHRLIFKLIEENTVQGLRIDHIDGLYDPAGYLDRIRKKNPEMYVTVEKILAFDEELPAHWPVQGTTGYDFLNRVNGIFCDPLNETRFNQIYARFAGPQKPYSDLVSEKKRLIIGKYMAGDVDALAHLLKTISSRDRYGSDITLYGLRRALVEVLTFFPVYRSYVSPQIYDTADRQHIQESVRKAREANPGLLHELNFIERFLLLNVGAHTAAEDKHQWIHFVMRFQQLTGPLMAKGFEDTLLYVYNRLLSLNEVGGDPGQFGGGIDQFHAFNGNRARRWPHAMNATSTHDTKRGEDARARINVLSEQPDEWEKTLRLWSKINAPARPVLRGQAVPDRNDEYFFYQTLIGAFPLQTEQSRDFLERLKAYIVKSVREAKVHTEWLKPDQAYENAFVAFIDKILCASESNRFLGEFLPFARKVAYHGMLNSLSQTLLKIFSPGVPDFYQGSELWDLNFVDPDNRRPVDFSRRAEMLGNLRRQEAGCLGLASQLLAQWEDGQVKLFVIYKALRFRRAYKELFLDGDYLPLYAKGPAQEHICAFARHKQGQWSLVTVPRLTTKLTTPENPPVGAAIWNSTSIMLPQGAPDKWINILTGEELGPCRTGKDRGLLMDAVFHEFPLGLLAPVQ